MGYEGKLLEHTAGNLFRKRGIRIGDIVYVITVSKGILYILGKLAVGSICDENQAAVLLKCSPEELWKAADHIVASRATPAKFDRSVPIEIAESLEFVRGDETVTMKFKEKGRLDQQTLRGVREMSHSSAELLESHFPELKDLRHLTIG